MMPSSSRSVLLYLAEDDAGGAPLAHLAALPVAERVFRAAARAGYGRIVVWAPRSAGALSTLGRRVSTRVEMVGTARDWHERIAGLPRGVATVVGPGIVPSTALLERARDVRPPAGALVDVPAGPAWPRSGLWRIGLAEAGDVNALLAGIRERLPDPAALPSGDDASHGRAMLALRVTDDPSRERAEAALLRATYKSTDNKLARFNRRLSLPISLMLLRTPITANQISVVLVAMGFYAAWLFSLGTYAAGVLAAALSLAASILDGCDGEIARLKYQESAFGCWLETIGDYSYYLAIFTGLTIGAVRATGWPIFYWLGGMAMAGTLLSFALLVFLRNRITAGRPERLHAIAKQRFKSEPTWWSRLAWKLSFCATRSAMPYGILFFAVIGLLPAIVALAALGANVYWISLLLKLRHLLGTSVTETAQA